MADSDAIRIKGAITLTGDRAFLVPAGFTEKELEMSEVIETQKSKKFAIPQVIHADRPEMADYDGVYKSACKHMKGLSKAELELEEARDLCETLRGYLKESEDYTTETVVNLIEERIWKAPNRLDRHDSKHLNLFVAYFDLNGGAA